MYSEAKKKKGCREERQLGTKIRGQDEKGGRPTHHHVSCYPLEVQIKN
jgi:hypothetical protein